MKAKLRVEFLTQEGSTYILPLFEEFFRKFSNEFEIVHISYSPPMGGRPRVKLAMELLWLYGVVGFSRLAGRFIRGRLLGSKRLGRNAKAYYSLPQLAEAYGVPCKRIGNPNAPEVVEQISRRAPDLIVSVACPYILKSKLLNLPPLGCINIHHAPLPRYQGMMPTFWQMYNGEKKVGLTIHQMREKIDQGPVLLQEHIEIAAGESLDLLIRRSKRHAASCLAKVLRDIRTQQATMLVSTGTDGSYFTFPTFQQIREFHRKGLRAL